jgi:hypothetical protein
MLGGRSPGRAKPKNFAPLENLAIIHQVMS